MRKLLRRFDAHTLTASNPRRLERQRRQRLAAELAEFRTPAERLEFDQILSRHTAEQVREIEDLLPRRMG